MATNACVPLQLMLAFNRKFLNDWGHLSARGGDKMMPLSINPQTVLGAAFGALLLALSIPTAYAQSGAGAQANEGVIEEVLVTARKREESVLEIPESLSVITGEDINRQNVKALKDIGFKERLHTGPRCLRQHSGSWLLPR
ncbi:MAG: hypothetical protein OXH09_17905 [Gammaproteobacteria bacterium]|nr:hypothetical protein [Gammaproteobacteria bacterium]